MNCHALDMHSISILTLLTFMLFFILAFLLFFLSHRWIRHQQGRHVTRAVGFGDSDTDSSDDGEKSREEHVIFEDELLSGLSIWMDRVFDGTVKKVRLPYWPEMSK